MGQIGFHDFAGSTAVHMVGGLCALAGAKNGRTSYRKIHKEGKPVAIPGHNLPLGALGVFILWFCWFGFNCGSTTAATYNLGDIAMTTNLAGSSSNTCYPDCYPGTLWKTGYQYDNERRTGRTGSYYSKL